MYFRIIPTFTRQILLHFRKNMQTSLCLTLNRGIATPFHWNLYAIFIHCSFIQQKPLLLAVNKLTQYVANLKVLVDLNRYIVSNPGLLSVFLRVKVVVLLISKVSMPYCLKYLLHLFPVCLSLQRF